MTDKAYAVPLHEQLASVPRDARLIIDDADGRGTRFIPVGRMCHEAAEALRARLAQPEPDYSKAGFGKPQRDWPTRSEQYAFERGFQRAREITFELWQELTNEEIGEIIEASQITLKNYCSEEKQTEFARAIEAKLKQKNS